MIKHLSIFLCLTALSSAAKPLSISQQYWNDVSFQKAFNGSYAINARIEPSVTGEQRALLVKVQNAMQKGNKKTAYQTLANSPLTQSSAALLYNLGNIAFELEKDEQALKSYRKAIKQFPSFRRAHKNLGLLHLKMEKYEEAEKSLQKALELGDNSGSTMGTLGYCHLQKKQYASALQAYRIAQLTEPDVIEWKAGVAQCLSEIGDDKEALAMLSEVVEQRPEESSYQLLYANVLLQLERTQEAAAALELLRRNEKLDYQSLALLATLHVREDALPLAKPLFETLQKDLDEENASSYLRATESVIQAAEWQYAESLLSAIKDTIKLPTRAQNKQKRLKAFVLIQQGKEGAEKLLRDILVSTPHDGEALLLLADYLQSQQENVEAAMLYTRAAKLEKFAYRAHLEHGKMLVRTQRYKPALEQLEAAEKLRKSADLKRYIAAVRRLVAAS